MKFENTRVMNFEGALRGMRNPKESWKRSDSCFGIVNTEFATDDYQIAEEWMQENYPTLWQSNQEEFNEEYHKLFDEYDQWLLSNGILQQGETSDVCEVAFIGPNDMKLAQTLIRAGSEHRKFLRQIFVSVDITAPLYWWKEADTYKVSTTANSTSTMHKLTSKPITLDCFEIDDYKDNLEIYADAKPFCYTLVKDVTEEIIDFCEELRKKYLETKDERYWKELIRWLPESWLQTRTWTCSYETLYSIYHQRKNHRLNEWSGIHTFGTESFIGWIELLPYAKDLLLI